jgi:hypothetical protein
VRISARERRSVEMEAFRKQASKFKEQVAKQQQVGTIRDLIVSVSLSLFSRWSRGNYFP